MRIVNVEAAARRVERSGSCRSPLVLMIFACHTETAFPFNGLERLLPAGALSLPMSTYAAADFSFHRAISGGMPRWRTTLRVPKQSS
jgi:hypothetical protein